jgi:uncharacterized OB-fold protein
VTSVEAPALLDPALIAVDDGEPSLRGWRCAACRRLAFGVKHVCPTCGSREGRETRLARTARLETWTRVFAQTEYVVGYALVGDGEDDQEVRVFAPLEVADEASLEPGQQVEIRFRTGTIVWGDERLHQYFVPGGRDG